MYRLIGGNADPSPPLWAEKPGGAVVVPKDDRRGPPTGKLPVGGKIPDGVVWVDRAEVSADVTVAQLEMT